MTSHLDKYDDSGLERDVDDYDRRRDALHRIPADQQRSNAEYGKADFYGWSEDKARQATMPEEQSFPAYLRARGFKLD